MYEYPVIGYVGVLLILRLLVDNSPLVVPQLIRKGFHNLSVQRFDLIGLYTSAVLFDIFYYILRSSLSA